MPSNKRQQIKLITDSFGVPHMYRDYVSKFIQRDKKWTDCHTWKEYAFLLGRSGNHRASAIICCARRAHERRQRRDELRPWECFCDEAYYGMWCVRRKTERQFGQGYHINNQTEAEHLTNLLNDYHRKSSH